MRASRPSSSSLSLVCSSPAENEIILTFADDDLLMRLLGERDQNLGRIEDACRVKLAVRGYNLFISGFSADCLRAQSAIQTLCERLREGDNMSPGDVEALSRMARPHSAFGGEKSEPLISITTRRRRILARTPSQRRCICAFDQHELIFAVGPAGTGKTYLAVAYAAMLLETGRVDRILLSRPAVEAGERLGFLPGDVHEKMNPYLRPLYDALYDIIAPERVERDLHAGVIEIVPLAFMRGRTLSNAAILLDEAQNCTASQMKMFLTRFGGVGRVIVAGDPSQTDLPRSVPSGLTEALEILRGVEGVSIVRFSSEDIMRGVLTARVVSAYERASQRASLSGGVDNLASSVSFHASLEGGLSECGKQTVHAGEEGDLEE